MQELTLSRPSAWQSLLWKEWKQIEQVVATVALGFVGIQLLLLWIGLGIPELGPRTGVLGGTFVLALIAPFVAAIGCSGMLIGHERQTGSWAWSSGLPIRWTSALGSKLLVSTLSCLVVTAVLSIVPLTLFFFDYLPVDARQSFSATQMVQFSLPLLFVAETLFAFFLSSLVFRNTIFGMVITIACLLLVQPVLLAVAFASTQNLASELGFTVVTAILGLTALLVATAVAFRWRWACGQNWDLATFWSSYVESSVTNGMAIPTSVAFPAQPPTEWRTLWHLALSNCLALRVTAVMACIGLGVWSRNSSDIVVPDLFSLGLVIACYFLGFSTFEGDQTLARFRFLADRGVSPRKLFLSRFAAATSIGVVAVALAVFLRFATHGLTVDWLSLSLCLASFSIAALSALCFRQSMVSMTVGVVVIIVGAMFSNGVIEITSQPSVLNEFNLTEESHYDRIVIPILALSPLAWIIPIAGSYWLMPKWLIEENNLLHVHFWWLSLLGVMLPATLVSTPMLVRWLS